MLPSPKDQSQAVTPADELSVNATVRGASPVVGVPLKFAVGPVGPPPVEPL